MSTQFTGNHNLVPRVRDSFDSEGDGIADHNGLHYDQPRNQLDAQIQDASYLALRNLTIGYTLNPDVISKAGLGSLRIYAAATNLLYLMGDNYTSLKSRRCRDHEWWLLRTNNLWAASRDASPVVQKFYFWCKS